MSYIFVWLFGKPEWEIETDKATPDDFRELGKNLNERMNEVAEIVEKLESNGWERSGGLYDLHFYKGIKKKDADIELGKLGISADVEEDEDEMCCDGDGYEICCCEDREEDNEKEN